MAVLATYREREYAALYEFGEGGASPLTRLGAAIVDRVEACGRESGGHSGDVTGHGPGSGAGCSNGARPKLSECASGMA